MSGAAKFTVPLQIMALICDVQLSVNVLPVMRWSCLPRDLC